MSFKKPFRTVPVEFGPYYRAKRRRQAVAKVGRNVWFPLTVATLSAATFMWVFSAEPARRVMAGDVAVEAPARVYYSGCAEARAAGAAPIYEGEPGFRDEMDGDNDGIACEPYRRW